MSLLSRTVVIEHALSQTCRKCTAKYSLSDLPYKYVSIIIIAMKGTIDSVCIVMSLIPKACLLSEIQNIDPLKFKNTLLKKISRACKLPYCLVRSISNLLLKPLLDSKLLENCQHCLFYR